MEKEDYEALLELDNLTSRQREVIDSIITAGSIPKAANVLGISPRGVHKTVTACKRKLKKNEIDADIPDTLMLSGTSVLTKTDLETGKKDVILEWTKTKVDTRKTLAAIKEATANIVKSAEGIHTPTKPHGIKNDSLLVVYVNTDLHLGQYAWAEESGSDVDVDVVYSNTLKAMSVLETTVASSTECIVLDLGDTLHSSNDDARTKSGHVLDVDSRHARVYRALVEMKIKMIEMALRKHSKVKYTIVAGNHSELVSNYIMAMLSAWFRNEPRFSVDFSVALHKYHKHGEVLLGFHHGHATKMQRLPEVMVWDRKEDISDTTYRYWLTGHLHRDTVFDNPIARCESFRNNTGNDSWTQGSGYRGHKQSVAITYHKEFGEIARNICPIAMI